MVKFTSGGIIYWVVNTVHPWVQGVKQLRGCIPPSSLSVRELYRNRPYAVSG